MAAELKPGTDVPLVAILTPVYNGAKYLAETMESVQGLDYPNLVHVVVDNASTDATPDIIERFRNRRVPLLTARNATTLLMAANWNAAVALTPKEARYFWLLCADDTLAPHAITRTVEVAERDPTIVLVGCGKYPELPQDREVFEGVDIVRGSLREGNYLLNGLSVLIRHSLVDANQRFYDEHIASFDTEASYRACLRGRYGLVHEELLRYRTHAESTTATTTGKMKVRMFDTLLLLDRYGHVLGYREYQDRRKSYRRHYLRSLLITRFRHGDKATFDWHLKVLRARDDAAEWRDFADAIANWLYLTLTFKGHLKGISRRPVHRRTDVWGYEPFY